jgi:hypothetical protein
MGINEIPFVCAVKSYDILEVKNAMMMLVYCVTEYINCGLVIFMFCYILCSWLINDKMFA